MNFSLGAVVLLVGIYLAMLVAVAWLTERGVIPRKLARHPATYVLALGVFAGALATNGIVDFAYYRGYHFLLYYCGAGLAFVFSALLLVPLLRLSRVYQLFSLADLLAFRFRSRRVGAAITVAMCVAILPLLALQIEALGDSIHLLTGGNLGEQHGASQHQGTTLLIALLILGFTILFGARASSRRHRNIGLMTAVAFSSLLKLLLMLGLLVAVVFGVFDGPVAMTQWLQQSPEAEQQLTIDIKLASTHTLLLVFFAGAVCMPHMFYALFTDRTEMGHLRAAAWGFPLYLFLFSLPVLPLTWAGIKLGLTDSMDHAAMSIAQVLDSPVMGIVAFLATLAASSTTVMLSTVAVANMCLTYLVVPGRVMTLSGEQDIYERLNWLRRLLIAALVICSYTFYLSLGGRHYVTEMAVIAFSGTLQFLPGLLAVMYWPGANRRGLVAGLAAGLGLWFLSIMLPTIQGTVPDVGRLLAAGGMPRELTWSVLTLLSVGVNATLFIVVSLLTETSEEEQVAAEICCMDDRLRSTRKILSVSGVTEIRHQLAQVLGEKTAIAEVARALRELQFNENEHRPYALRRLRRRLEANLSSLLGPAVAHRVIERCIPFFDSGTQDLNLIERNLESGRLHFTGVAADLDILRRRYRETLNTLPVGICALSPDGEVMMWNQCMEEITGVAAEDAAGSLMQGLPQPWGETLTDFHAADEESRHKVDVATLPGEPRWVSLHRSRAEDSDTVIMVEDITDFERLEAELMHSERLASIGRLAAGVAHEIGNPVTGIACLAQNLEYEATPAEVQDTARDILRQTDRISRIVQSLVNFSHSGTISVPVDLKPCSLAECAGEAIALMRLNPEARDISFDAHCDPGLRVVADYQRLLQVLVNLLDNARLACEGEGAVTLRAHPAGERVLLDVEDNGSGIPPALQPRVFEPFFTTREPGSGTGLGLAFVYSIMEDMHGSISFTSPLSSGSRPGTRFTLNLPAASAASAGAEVTADDTTRV